MMKSTQKNTLTIHKEEIELFETKTGEYNIVKENHGYELTFSFDTKEVIDDEDLDLYNPKVEVTIICSQKPTLNLHQSWKNQPGYIDATNLYNVTNFYQWTHENFNNFDLEIVGKEGSLLTVLLTGYIELNAGSNIPVKVTAKAIFNHNPELTRGQM